MKTPPPLVVLVLPVLLSFGVEWTMRLSLPKETRGKFSASSYFCCLLIAGGAVAVVLILFNILFC